MLIHEIKFIVRSLIKKKIISLINIFGLAIGLASFILITLYVDKEFKTDKFQKNYNWIYRIENKFGAYNSDQANRLFKEQIPEVSLSGEAYFEVTHAPDQPFIVESGNGLIKVLGTKFNVSHYPDSKITEASLLSGKITMSLSGSREEIEIQPGQKVVYDTETQTYLKTATKAQSEILWRQGILIFDNKSFNDLIPELERYYAVKFTYEKAAFENIHYTGTIDNLSINKVLEFINLTIPVKYEIDNKTIKLYSSGKN